MSSSGGASAVDPDEEMENRREAAKKFFDGEGAMELLWELPHHGEKRFVEIVEDVSVSRATVSDRLQKPERRG